MRLRVGLVKTISGPVNQIAVQLGVTAAKAARYNVPQGWPELLPVLSEAVQAEDDTLQHRGLLFLHHTIKALATTGLTADRRTGFIFSCGCYDQGGWTEQSDKVTQPDSYTGP